MLRKNLEFLIFKIHLCMSSVCVELDKKKLSLELFLKQKCEWSISV